MIVGVGVMEGVRVKVGVKVGVEVFVAVAVGVGVDVGVRVGVGVGVANRAMGISHPAMMASRKGRRITLRGALGFRILRLHFHSGVDLGDGEIDRESSHRNPGFDGVKAACNQQFK